MAAPEVALNPKDPIVQALQAEAVAQENYNTAGYHRNLLEMKAKKGDAQAKAELPAAQKQVEIAQENLKRVQSYLALLTGTPNPHAKQKVARTPPEKTDKTSVGEKVASKKPGSRPVGEKEVEKFFDRTPPKRVAAYFEMSIRREIHFNLLDNKALREELEKFINKPPADLKKLPKNGEIIRIIKPLEVYHGEMMTRVIIKKESAPLRASLQEYLK